MAKTRQIPRDENAECVVLGSLLLDSAARVQIRDILAADMFFSERNRLIYEACLAVDVCDVVTVAAELKRRGEFERCGQDRYLVECINSAPSSIFVEHYANIVKTNSYLRQLIDFQSNMSDMIYGQDSVDVTEVWRNIRSGLDALQPDSADEVMMDIAQSVDTALIKQDERREMSAMEDSQARRIKLPWKNLDFVGRLREGSVTVCAAESSVGKTALAETCAEFWAEQGFHTAFVHLELSHQVMIDRRTARQTGITMDELDAGKLNPQQMKLFYDAIERVSRWAGNITYIHAPGWTASRIAAGLERLHALKQLDVVVVDYLTMIPFETNTFGLNSAQATANQVRILKEFSDTTGIPLVLLSQITPDDSSTGIRKGHRLRNSREIFEKANVVLTFDRKIKPESDGGDGVSRYDIATVAVEKKTWGRLGTAKLKFVPERFMWRDVFRLEEYHRPAHGGLR